MFTVRLHASLRPGVVEAKNRDKLGVKQCFIWRGYHVFFFKV